MRKRIAKELPKVEAELKKTLEQFEDEYGRPFLVHGARYLDELYASASKAPPPRSKTPSAAPLPAKAPPSSTKQPPKSVPSSRPGTVRGTAPAARAKTPTATPNFGASVRGNPLSSSVMSNSTLTGSVRATSPSKIPARAPLKNLAHGGNSPERRPQLEREDSSTIRKMGPPRAPPPKMKDLFSPPEPAATPTNYFEFSRGDRSDSIVRHVAPEDPYDDRNYMSHSMAGYPRFAPPSNSRQISQTSTSSTGTGHTMQSGSENWETFSEQSEDPERDVDFHKMRQQAARNKRYTPEGGYPSPRGAHSKKLRSIRGVDSGMMTEDGGHMVRVVEGSEAGWTDEDGY